MSNILQGMEEEIKEIIRRYVEDMLQERVRRLRLEVLHTAPRRPRAGELFFADGTDWNPGAGRGVYEFDGTNYNKLYTTGGGGGGSVTISSTAPSTPTVGDLWWNLDTGILYIYYNDGTSSQWVAAGDGALASSGGGGSGTVTSVAATAPAAGFTISGSPITISGTLTFALANDLLALENLASTGYARRTGTDTWVLDGTIPWGSLSGVPSTLAGYGISDAAPLSHVGAGGTAHANATTSVAGFMSAADKTKLDGVQAGATANSSDATLLNRANHTGTQVASTISDFSEAVDDRVAALLVAGSNITLTYNDGANTLTIAASGGGGSLPSVDANDFWKEHWFGANNTDGPQLFLGSAIGSGTNSTAPATTNYSPRYNPFGGVLLRCSATNPSGYRYQTVRIDSMWFGVKAYKFQTRLILKAALASRVIRLGYLDTTTNTDATDGAYFELNAGVASAKTANNSTRTTNVTTASLSLDVPYDFDIEVDAAGANARFRITNADTLASVLDVTNTTDIPTTSARAFGAGVIANSTTAAAADICLLIKMHIGTLAGYTRARG